MASVAVIGGDQSTAALVAELEEIRASAMRLSADQALDGQEADKRWADWCERLGAATKCVAALPMTVDNVPIRALGVRCMYVDDLNGLLDAASPERLLMGQIVATLAS